MADDPKPEIKEPNQADEHPDYPGLTYAEVAKAKEKARKTIEAEQKRQALDKITEQEEAAIRAHLGQTERAMHEIETLSPTNREMVEITLALPPQMPDIRIDGVIFKDRGTYKVTRAKAADMLKIQYEGWYHESQRKGDDRYAFYAQMNQANRGGAVINTRSGILTNAPRGTHG